MASLAPEVVEPLVAVAVVPRKPTRFVRHQGRSSRSCVVVPAETKALRRPPEAVKPLVRRGSRGNQNASSATRGRQVAGRGCRGSRGNQNASSATRGRQVAAGSSP